MTKTQKKYTFTLNMINISKINHTYNIEKQDEIFEEEKEYTNTTRITDLNISKSIPETISFLDDSKRPRTCIVSMIDFESKMNVNLLRYHCFWCRHPFDTQPIGCPLKYVSSQAEKKYYSVNQDIYTIKENITVKQRKKLVDKQDLTIKMAEYYETDGVFCSFNCCQAWVNDNKHIRKYDRSAMLLMKMYNNMNNTKAVIITPAPHWRLLEQYGGHLNIIKYRESFNKVDYIHHGHTNKLPLFFPIGNLYEEHIKF